MNFIWGVIRGLSIIAYLALINITFAPNFMLVTGYIISFITFDIVPGIDEINEYLFTTRYSEIEIEKEALGFGLLGFETHNYFKNTGSMWIFIFYMIVSSVFFKNVRRFADNYICVQFYKKYRVNENLNALLMIFAMQGYIELLLSSLISI